MSENTEQLAISRSHPAYYVDGPDHQVSSDSINGRFNIYVTGDLDLIYTDSSGQEQRITTSDELASSAAADETDYSKLTWVQRPWFKIIDENGVHNYGEVFDYLDTAMQLANEAAIRTSNE